MLLYTATASSQFGGHSAQQAIDGVVTSETCYWSEPSVSSWWELDLGVDMAISKIRITNTVCLYLTVFLSQLHVYVLYVLCIKWVQICVVTKVYVCMGICVVYVVCW